jgi:hypothetical protein
MIDPVPPAPAPVTPTVHQNSVFNQAQTAALSEADKVCVAAAKPAYAPLLALREITAAEVTQLVADILTCRQTAAGAAHSTTSKVADVSAEHVAETNLMTAVHEVQAAARQKYGRTNPILLNDYLIGHTLNPNQATFKQSVQHLITRLDADTLPGITPAKTANLPVLLATYAAASVNPAGDQSDATTQRRQRNAQISAINDQRMTIQFAADAEWPYTVDANAGIRVEFFLPAHQPFKG